MKILNFINDVVFYMYVLSGSSIILWLLIMPKRPFGSFGWVIGMPFFAGVILLPFVTIIDFIIRGIKKG